MRKADGYLQVRSEGSKLKGANMADIKWRIAVPDNADKDSGIILPHGIYILRHRLPDYPGQRVRGLR